jgi:hypothetical protein
MIKDQLANAKRWAANNRNLAIGVAATGALAVMASVLALLPIWKSKTKNRSGKHRRESRLMRRAIDDSIRTGGIEQDFDDDEVLDYLAGLVELDED